MRATAAPSGVEAGDRGAGVHEQTLAGRDRLDQRGLDRRAHAVLRGAQREPALRVDPHDRHRVAVVAAGDAVLELAALRAR